MMVADTFDEYDKQLQKSDNLSRGEEDYGLIKYNFCDRFFFFKDIEWIFIFVNF